MQIPQLYSHNTVDIFTENKLFCNVDFNLSAWLPDDFGETGEVEIKTEILDTALNNQELLEKLGGEAEVRSDYVFTPAQINYLVSETDVLLKNGYSNLFFVENSQTDELYLVGVVYNSQKSKWTPYIYRLYNLYRAWSAGNQVFTKV
jgi:hypothetical protein